MKKAGNAGKPKKKKRLAKPNGTVQPNYVLKIGKNAVHFVARFPGDKLSPDKPVYSYEGKYGDQASFRLTTPIPRDVSGTGRLHRKP